MKPALLVVDIQNAWMMEKGLGRSVKRHLETVNAAIKWFRKHRLPMVVISHEEKKSGVVPGTRAFEFYDAVEVKKTDPWITKRFPNSFAETDLASFVRKKGCDSVVICGLSATWCVLATYFGAYDCGLSPYLLKDGVAAPDEAQVRFVETTYEAIDLRRVGEMMGR